MRTSNFLSTSEGSKYLLCDGSEIPSSYAKLRSLMTHTPDLRDRVPQGAGVYTVNSIIEPALPNITGSFIGLDENFDSLGWWGGAFYYIQAIRCMNTNSSASGNSGEVSTIFNASRCSSIYKDGVNTVQPPALAVNFYIKAK